jgi:TonB family protein
MDKQRSNLKRMFMLHVRIGFLVTIVVFILGFIFMPEFETKYYEPKVRTIIKIDKVPDQLENIVEPIVPEKPKIPVAAETDEEAEAETIDRTTFIDDYGKISDIDFEPPPFVPYDVEPKLLNSDKVKFEYPESVRILGIEGTVYLELWIDKEGNVRNVKLAKSLYSTLDKIAVQNAKNLKFSPAMQRDKPVAVRLSFPVTFKLR